MQRYDNTYFYTPILPKDRLNAAIDLANFGHKGIYDKSGVAYILHPVNVMLQFSDELDMSVAIMHDLLEDVSWIEPNMIEDMFGAEIFDALMSVTRKRKPKFNVDENYMDFIRRCSLHHRGRRIKLMDIRDNRRPERYNPTLKGLEGRYVKAQAFLVDAMKDGSLSDVEFLHQKNLIGYDEYRTLLGQHKFVDVDKVAPASSWELVKAWPHSHKEQQCPNT